MFGISLQQQKARSRSQKLEAVSKLHMRFKSVVPSIVISPLSLRLFFRPLKPFSGTISIVKSSTQWVMGPRWRSKILVALGKGFGP